MAHKLIGIVEVEEAGFKKSAILQWTKELIESCRQPLESSTSFLSLLKKRVEVQQRFHDSYLRERERLSRHSEIASSATTLTSVDLTKPSSALHDSHTGGVPIVVRLGVMTMFPLIKTISKICSVT